MNTLLFDLSNIVNQKKFAGVSDITLKILLKERLQDYVLGFIYNHKEYGKLFDLGLSPFESENLHIKVEVNQQI